MNCSNGCGKDTKRLGGKNNVPYFCSISCENEWYVKTNNSPSKLHELELDPPEVNDRLSTIEKAREGCKKAAINLYKKWGISDYLTEETRLRLRTNQLRSI